MTPFGFVVVVAATYGATRFVVVDSLLRGPRNWLIERLYPQVFLPTDSRDARAMLRVAGDHGARVPDNAPGWRGKLAELLACPYCAGWWIGLVLFACYGADGWARVLVEAWAIRGLHAATLDAMK